MGGGGGIPLVSGKLGVLPQAVQDVVVVVSPFHLLDPAAHYLCVLEIKGCACHGRDLARGDALCVLGRIIHPAERER